MTDMWYDKLEGVVLDKKNGAKIAQWIEGEHHHVKEDGKDVHFVIASTARGDVLIREGDIVARDMDQRFRIVRINVQPIESFLEKKNRDASRRTLKVVDKKYDPTL